MSLDKPCRISGGPEGLEVQDVLSRRMFPFHALHDKGLQKTKRRRSTGQQQGTKSGRRPADKPDVNRWSTAGFVPRSV